MTTLRDGINNYSSVHDQNTSNEQGDRNDNNYKGFISNKLKEYHMSDEQEKFMRLMGDNAQPKQEIQQVTNEQLVSELMSDKRKQQIPDIKHEFTINRKETDRGIADNYKLEHRALRNSGSRWENATVNNDRISYLEKQLEAQKLSHDQEIQEITKSFEGELLKAIEVKESERQLANKRILDRSKYEVENHMMQFQVERHQDENIRLKSIVGKLEKENLQLQEDLLNVQSQNDRTLLEATSAKEEFDEKIAKLKESFSRDASSMENEYTERIKRISDEKDLITNLMEEKSKKILELAERINCLETEINNMKSQLNLKEGERISYIEKCSENESKIILQQEKLDDLILQKNGLDRFIISQEKQREALTAKISDLTKRYDYLQSLFNISEEHKAELGKKLIASSGELASSQEFVAQLKNEIQSLTSQLKRNQETSIQEQENFEVTVKRLASELAQEKEFRKSESLQAIDVRGTMNVENSKLREMISELEKEKAAMCNKMLDCSKIEGDLEVKLECEQQLRSSLEMKLDETECQYNMSIMVNSELAETLNAAECIKLNYEKEIELKAKSLKELENLVSEKDKIVRNSQAMIKLLRKESNEYASKNNELENEYKLAREQVKNLELNYERMVANELREKCKEIDLLKLRLDEALDCRQLQSEAIVEFEKQLDIVESKLYDKEEEFANLLKKLKDKDEIIYKLKQKQKSLQKEHGVSGSMVKALSSQALSLQEECNSLKEELESANQALEGARHQAMEERKQCELINNKSSREKNALESLMLQSKSALEVCERRLEKEIEWRKKTEVEMKRIKEESDSNLLKISNLEEAMSIQKIDHREVLAKQDFFATENRQLREALIKANEERGMIERWKREQDSIYQMKNSLLSSSPERWNTELHTSQPTIN